jgi:tetratricopeptide (TPR) repeat protein
MLFVEAVMGQSLSLKRDLPALPSNACAARGYVYEMPQTPSTEVAEGAESLASEASQAAILGQYEQARDLLREGTALDGTSSSLSYSLGRLLESGGELESALAEYCRFVVIAPSAGEAADVEQRIESIGIAVGALGLSSARAAFEAGLGSFDRGDYDQAVLDFSRALVEQSDWDQAHFNRAVAYLSSGREAAGVADLEFYLELAPQASDRAEIEGLLEELGPIVEYNPRTALVSGLFIPGMGYFYSGRPGAGILALSAAGASLGFAILNKEVKVSCLSPPVNGQCPRGEIISEGQKRPMLVPGLAVATAITIFGAIHASRGVRRSALQASRGGGLEASLPRTSLWGWEPTLRVEPALVSPRGGAFRAELEVRF